MDRAVWRSALRASSREAITNLTVGRLSGYNFVWHRPQQEVLSPFFTFVLVTEVKQHEQIRKSRRWLGLPCNRQICSRHFNLNVKFVYLYIHIYANVYKEAWKNIEINQYHHWKFFHLHQKSPSQPRFACSGRSQRSWGAIGYCWRLPLRAGGQAWPESHLLWACPTSAPYRGLGTVLKVAMVACVTAQQSYWTVSFSGYHGNYMEGSILLYSSLWIWSIHANYCSVCCIFWF